MKNRIYAVLNFVKDYALVSLSVFVASFTVVLGFMFWYPYNPIRIDSLWVSEDNVRVGDEVCFRLKGEKFMALPVYATMELVNGEGTVIETFTGGSTPGTEFPERCFIIPLSMKTNYYRLKFSGIYPVNGFQSILRIKYSESIYIVNDIDIRRERQGQTGKTGKQGPAGAPGQTGKTGQTGATGLTGKQGEGFWGKK